MMAMLCRKRSSTKHGIVLSLLLCHLKCLNIISILYSVESSVQNIVCCVAGSNPTQNHKTLINLTLNENNQNNDWDLRVVETINNETTLAITPAADCIVGYYSTYVSVVTSLGKVRSQRNKKTDFYVLFNPWAPGKQNQLRVL